MTVVITTGFKIGWNPVTVPISTDLEKILIGVEGANIIKIDLPIARLLVGMLFTSD